MGRGEGDTLHEMDEKKEKVKLQEKKEIKNLNRRGKNISFKTER